MTIYLNPKFGDDATAALDDAQRPFKTHAAALAAGREWSAANEHQGFAVRESHRPLQPAPPAET